MSSLTLLTNLEVGDFATVKTLNAETTTRRRLQDMGLIEGTNIKCVLKSPGKDPIAYEIRGAIIALRSEDTNQILVSIS